LLSTALLLGSALKKAIALCLIFGCGLKHGNVCLPSLLRGCQCDGIEVGNASSGAENKEQDADRHAVVPMLLHVTSTAAHW
jgi:hypothetical protein